MVEVKQFKFPVYCLREMFQFYHHLWNWISTQFLYSFCSLLLNRIFKDARIINYRNFDGIEDVAFSDHLGSIKRGSDI